MADWKETREFDKYPYHVWQAHDGWAVTWHHQAAGVSHEIAKNLESPEQAMAQADVHGNAHGWKPCPSRGH